MGSHAQVGTTKNKQLALKRKKLIHERTLNQMAEKLLKTELSIWF